MRRRGNQIGSHRSYRVPIREQIVVHPRESPLQHLHMCLFRVHFEYRHFPDAVSETSYQSSPSRQCSVTPPSSTRLRRFGAPTNRWAKHDRLAPKKGNEVDRKLVPVAAGVDPTIPRIVAYPGCALTMHDEGTSAAELSVGVGLGIDIGKLTHNLDYSTPSTSLKA